MAPDAARKAVTSGCRRRPARVVAAFAAAAALTLAGCTTPITDVASSDDAGLIKLGLLVPLSGVGAGEGLSIRDAAWMALDDAGAKDERFEVGGRHVTLLVRDDACDSRSAATQSAELLEEGVVAAIGGSCSAAALAALTVLEAADVPVVFAAANATALSNRERSFLLNGTAEAQAAAAVAGWTERGASKVVVVHDTSSYGEELAGLTVAAATAAGQPRPSTVVMTSTLEDQAAQIAAVAAKDPDLVYVVSYGDPTAAWTTGLMENGFEGMLMVGDGAGQDYLDAAGPSAEGVLATSPAPAHTLPQAADWVRRYESRYDAEPTTLALQGYHAVRVLLDALRRADSFDGADVTAALEATNLDAFGETLTFDDQHMASTGGFVVLVVRDGEYVLAAP